MLFNTTLRRGEVYFADLGQTTGAEQRGMRPVLVVQNEVDNVYSPNTIVLPMTSKLWKADLPTNVQISRQESGMNKDCLILAGQVRTIDKWRLKGQAVACLGKDIMRQVDRAMLVSMGISAKLAPAV